MRILCSCAYDGTNFYGFQIQPELRTVQGEIEKVLTQIHKYPVSIVGASRTDAKVHALNQYFHFDTTLNISQENLKKALNSLLPDDIYITECKVVDDDFHCRYQSTMKEYHYIIDFGPYNPLYRNYRYFYPFSLEKFSFEILEEASKVFIGKHDFKSFTKTKTYKNTVRTIYNIDFELQNNLLTIKFIGDGFLHHMVRIIVAMMLSCVQGKYSISDLKQILAGKNRQLAPEIAPPYGLYLYKIYYD